MDDKNIELALATVENRYTDGLTVVFDGMENPSQKLYKQMYTGRSLQPEDRVLMIKISGTWLVAGKIDKSQPRYYLDPLASSASLADVISRVNSVINILTTLQIFTPRS